MDPKFRDLLKQRHDFESWPKSTSRLRITSFSFTGEELPGLKLLRVDRQDTPEGPLMKSVWKRSDDEFVAVDVRETSSPATAYEAVIEFLGEFESPLMARLPGNPYGDIAFGMPGETAILFVLGNLVVLLRNAGPKPITLAALAQSLIQALAERK